MSDPNPNQAQIDSLYSSASSYDSTASYWSGVASEAQGTINSLNPQLQHKLDQKKKVDHVSGRMGELDNQATTVNNDLQTLGQGIGTQMDGDNGALSTIINIDNDNQTNINTAKSECTKLATKLQQEIDSLRAQIASATETRDNANRKAASARSSAAACRSRAASLA